MKSLIFASRNGKEIIRDPLSVIFGVGFPVVLLFMITLVKNSVKDMPDNMFMIEDFAPGMAVFGLSFISLFLGVLISNDRNQAFLTRLFATPLKDYDYIIGYSLPLLPIAVIQTLISFLTALCLGLSFSWNILLVLLVSLPIAVLFIGFGLLFESLFNGNQVSGIGSVLVNVVALLSGIWFNLDMIGGVFKTICYTLPFAHAVDVMSDALKGNYSEILPHLLWCMGYAVVIYILAVFVFRRKMKG